MSMMVCRLEKDRSLKVEFKGQINCSICTNDKLLEQSLLSAKNMYRGGILNI